MVSTAASQTNLSLPNGVEKRDDREALDQEDYGESVYDHSSRSSYRG